MDKNYNIGLDIGTNSVGWSVIDDNFNLLKFKKKNMWGVRLFDEGETAEARRINRSSRRRLNRRRQRVNFLQQLMSEEIEKVDRLFFMRLKESFLHLEDREDNINKSNLFVGRDFSDKDYYEKYPTIYHLRESLIKNPEKQDIRLVYLAIHHIIKYRGNFLYEGQNFDSITGNIEESIQELIDEVSRLEIADIKLNSKDIKDIIENKNNSRQKKVDILINGEKISKNQMKNIFNGIVGLKVDLAKIFKGIVFDEEISFKFSDDDIDEKLEKAASMLGEDYFLLEIIQKIYNWLVMGAILGGNEYISFAKVKSFEKYKKELKILKDIMRYYDYKLYKDIFKEKLEGANYETYIKDKNKIVKGKNKTAKELFYDRINKFIESNLDDSYMTEEKKYILKEIEKDNFLIIQNTKDNSAIPYQLNEIELIKILDNQSKHYKTIEENKEKILRLLNFRVPYYVGPLNQHSEFAWVQRIKGMENEKIYPWNMEKIVDIDESAERFIKKMTNKCTYLVNEDVIPKNSLLYLDYIFYNEINKIEINGQKLDKEQKENLKESLFLEKKTVTSKDIENWCKNNQLFNSKDYKVCKLQGDNKATSTLSSYIDFIKIFKEVNLENRNLSSKEIIKNEIEPNREMIEKIIAWLTIFEDKGIVKKKICRDYPDFSENKEILNKILKLKYRGWGRFSKKLLNGIYTVDSYQRKRKIIDTLKDTNLNFMQIINKKELGFDKKIKEENKLENTDKITYNNLVKNLQGSPKIKRGVWQSIKIIEEIIKVMGCYPKNIFIEFAREDQDSKRTSSKKNKLLKLYESLDKTDSNYINQDAKKLLKNNNVDNKRKQLYFMQLGKCMYTGEPLDFDSLNLYETDHIIYQSLIKDDSMDNLVLVKKDQNQNRSNQVMPVNFVTDDIKIWWEYLKEKGLISSKKYNNLMKRNLNRYEEEGFINRQLVETRQISKHVTNILLNCYEREGTKIIPIKAALVDDFKKQFDIYKNREINDYHHAKDALITSVIGNYILNRFPKLNSDFIYNEYKKYKSYDDDRINKYGFILGSMNKTYQKDGQVIWKENESISHIKKQLNYKDCNITKQAYENKGKLFKETMYPKVKNKKLINNKIPIKSNLDIRKYGYYEGEEVAYSSIIEYKNKSKRVKALIGVPIRCANKIGSSNEKLKKYFEEERKLEDVKILKAKVLKYQLFENEKGIFYLASTEEWHNAKQLLLEEYYEEIIYKMSKSKYSNSITEEQLLDVYEKIIEKISNHYFIFSNLATKISNKREVFVSLSKEEKVKILLELLKITKANGNNANLKIIKESDRVGRLSGKNMKIDNTTFIYQSITGLFVNRERY